MLETYTVNGGCRAKKLIILSNKTQLKPELNYTSKTITLTTRVKTNAPSTRS